MKKRNAFIDKRVVGCGKLKVVIEEKDDKPIDCGIFFSKSGTCGASQVEGISRLIALLFKRDVDISLIIKHLKGIQCSSPHLKEGEESLSCADAIAKCLEGYIVEARE